MNLEILLRTIQNSLLDMKMKCQDEIEKNQYNYRTFGTVFEKFVLETLAKTLKFDSNIKVENALTKNSFPDCKIKWNDIVLAIDVKCGHNIVHETQKSLSCCNNDMGTINSWQAKLEKNPNIYFLFIEYSCTNDIKKICNITFQEFYKYLGINSEGMLRYREKDGNLRPAPFKMFDNPKITNLTDFQILLHKTSQRRAYKLVMKHYLTLPSEHQNIFRKEISDL